LESGQGDDEAFLFQGLSDAETYIASGGDGLSAFFVRGQVNQEIGTRNEEIGTRIEERKLRLKR